MKRKPSVTSGAQPACAGSSWTTLIGMALLVGGAPLVAVGQSAAAPAQPEANQLQEIIVTAERRESNLQKTPIAVTAIDSNALEQLAPVTLMDVARLVPNFSANKVNGFNAAAFAMRGVGNTDIIVYNEAPITVLVDDFVMPSVQSQLLDPFDVSRRSAARTAGYPVRQEHHRWRGRGAHQGTAARPVHLRDAGPGRQLQRLIVQGAVNFPMIDNHLALRLVASQET